MEEKSDLLCVALRAGKESMHKSLVRRLLINIRILWAAECTGATKINHIFSVLKELRVE